MENIREIIAKNKALWQKKEYRTMVLTGGAFFIASVIINHLASGYANLSASSYVSDLLLDHLPVVDVDGVLNFGTLLFGAFMVWNILKAPKVLPLVLKSMALFVFTRSIFITLTHMGAVPSQMTLDSNRILSRLLIGNDFFFSGHTGLPFLLALIFWEQKTIRHVALACSFIFAVGVILGHFHYSIDVGAAFFISHSIYYISISRFRREYALFSGK